MADTITTPTPIFYEALAAVAICTPGDAFEHYHTTVNANPRGRTHPVESFLEDYAVASTV